MGRRLHAAAVAAGLSANDIAAQLNMKPATINRWWRDQRAPSPSNLQAYAACIGRPIAFFCTDQPACTPRALELASLLLAWTDRLLNYPAEVTR